MSTCQADRDDHSAWFEAKEVTEKSDEFKEKFEIRLRVFNNSTLPGALYPPIGPKKFASINNIGSVGNNKPNKNKPKAPENAIKQTRRSSQASVRREAVEELQNAEEVVASSTATAQLLKPKTALKPKMPKSTQRPNGRLRDGGKPASLKQEASQKEFRKKASLEDFNPEIDEMQDFDGTPPDALLLESLDSPRSYTKSCDDSTSTDRIFNENVQLTDRIKLFRRRDFFYKMKLKQSSIKSHDLEKQAAELEMELKCTRETISNLTRQLGTQESYISAQDAYIIKLRAQNEEYLSAQAKGAQQEQEEEVEVEVVEKDHVESDKTDIAVDSPLEGTNSVTETETNKEKLEESEGSLSNKASRTPLELESAESELDDTISAILATCSSRKIEETGRDGSSSSIRLSVTDCGDRSESDIPLQSVTDNHIKLEDPSHPDSSTLLDEHVAKIAQLEILLVQSEDKLKASEQRIEDLLLLALERKDHLNTAIAQIEHLRNQLQKAENDGLAATNRASSLQGELGNVKEELLHLHSRAKELQSKCDNLEASLAKAESESRGGSGSYDPTPPAKSANGSSLPAKSPRRRGGGSNSAIGQRSRSGSDEEESHEHLDIPKSTPTPTASLDPQDDVVVGEGTGDASEKEDSTHPTNEVPTATAEADVATEKEAKDVEATEDKNNSDNSVTEDPITDDPIINDTMLYVYHTESSAYEELQLLVSDVIQKLNHRKQALQDILLDWNSDFEDLMEKEWGNAKNWSNASDSVQSTYSDYRMVQICILKLEIFVRKLLTSIESNRQQISLGIDLKKELVREIQQQEELQEEQQNKEQQNEEQEGEPTTA